MKKFILLFLFVTLFVSLSAAESFKFEEFLGNALDAQELADLSTHVLSQFEHLDDTQVQVSNEDVATLANDLKTVVNNSKKVAPDAKKVSTAELEKQLASIKQLRQELQKFKDLPEKIKSGKVSPTQAVIDLHQVVSKNLGPYQAMAQHPKIEGAIKKLSTTPIIEAIAGRSLTADGKQLSSIERLQRVLKWALPEEGTPKYKEMMNKLGKHKEIVERLIKKIRDGPTALSTLPVSTQNDIKAIVDDNAVRALIQLMAKTKYGTSIVGNLDGFGTKIIVEPVDAFDGLRHKLGTAGITVIKEKIWDLPKLKKKKDKLKVMKSNGGVPAFKGLANAWRQLKANLNDKWAEKLEIMNKKWKVRSMRMQDDFEKEISRSKRQFKRKVKKLKKKLKRYKKRWEKDYKRLNKLMKASKKKLNKKLSKKYGGLRKKFKKYKKIDAKRRKLKKGMFKSKKKAKRFFRKQRRHLKRKIKKIAKKRSKLKAKIKKLLKKGNKMKPKVLKRKLKKYKKKIKRLLKKEKKLKKRMKKNKKGQKEN